MNPMALSSVGQGSQGGGETSLQTKPHLSLAITIPIPVKSPSTSTQYLDLANDEMDDWTRADADATQELDRLDAEVRAAFLL